MGKAVDLHTALNGDFVEKKILLFRSATHGLPTSENVPFVFDRTSYARKSMHAYAAPYACFWCTSLFPLSGLHFFSGHRDCRIYSREYALVSKIQATQPNFKIINIVL